MKFKKLMIIFTVVLAIMGLSVTALAVDTKAVETDAKTAEWKAARLERMQERLNTLVAAGKMTREQANTMLEAMKQRQADCDGTNCVNGGVCDGTGAGAGFGGGRDNKGEGRGQGMGMGMGRFGNREGTCLYAAGEND